MSQERRGEATLWMVTNETYCGFRPVLAWPNVDGLQDFAKTLLGICSQINSKDSNGISCPADESLDKTDNGK